MSQYPAKLKRVFFPFLIVSVCTITFYTLLNWLLVIKHRFVIDKDIVNFDIPAIMPWIPLLIWVRPRIKLLNLDKVWGKQPVSLLMFLVLWPAIFIPMVIAQSYLLTATGKLTRLDAMSQVSARPVTKYYQVKRFYVDKSLARTKAAFSVSGKGRQNYNIIIYITVPVFDQLNAHDTITVKPHLVTHYKLNPAVAKPLVVINGVLEPDSSLKYIDAKSIAKVEILKSKAATDIYGDLGKKGAILITTRAPKSNLQQVDPPLAMEWPAAWMGFKYQETISNRRSIDEKRQEYNRFLAECIAKFNTADLAGFNYLDRIEYSKDQQAYLDAVNSSRYGSINKQVIIVAPVYEPFEKRNGNKLTWILGTFTIGIAVLLTILWFIDLKEPAVKV